MNAALRAWAVQHTALRIVYFAGAVLLILAALLGTASAVALVGFGDLRTSFYEANEAVAQVFGMQKIPAVEAILGMTTFMASWMPAVFLLNRVLRRQGAPGYLDAKLAAGAGKGSRRVLFVWAGLAGFFALALLVWIAVRSATFYFDSDQAAEGMKQARIAPRAFSNTDTVLFGRDNAGRMHYAVLTPDLVRGLRERGVGVGAPTDFQSDRLRPLLVVDASGHADRAEFPLPGVLPLLGLLAVLAAILSGLSTRTTGATSRKSAPRSWLARRLAVAMFVVSYVCVWFATAQYPFIHGNGVLNQAHKGAKIILALLVVIAAVVVFRKFRDAQLPARGAAAWASLFLLLMLIFPWFAFLPGIRTDGSPVELWLLLYSLVLTACAAAICWRVQRIEAGRP